MKLGVIIDPITELNPDKDSTIAMLRAASAKGIDLYAMSQDDLDVLHGKPMATMLPLAVSPEGKDWYQAGTPTREPIANLNIVLMRKDPPFDLNYIYTTYFLELAEKEGVLVANKPQSLRDANEKYFTSLFPNCCPPTLISQNMARLKDFWIHHDDVVYKPLHGMGGRMIFRVKETGRNLNVILDTITEGGTVPIMAQKYIPAIKTQGDRRILIVDDYVVPYALARIPQGDGDERGNLAQGAKGEVLPITEHERQLAQCLIPTLQKKGLTFVGIDVIGDYITEINVTSPTCIVEIEKATNEKIAERLIDKLLTFVENKARNF